MLFLLLVNLFLTEQKRTGEYFCFILVQTQARYLKLVCTNIIDFTLKMIRKNLLFTPRPELCGVEPPEVAGDEILGVVRVSNTPVRRVSLATCLAEGSLALRENLAKFFYLYGIF